jgi:hypothetical protein
MLDDDPITLKEACEIVFRNTCTPATLRAESKRGNLDISRIGKRDFTTLRSARELFDKCRVEQKAPASIVTRRAVSTSSATDRASLDAAQRALSKLRNGWPNISPENIGRSKARPR